MLDSDVIKWGQRFQSKNWEDFYPHAKEELPPKMPEPLGKSAQINCFVDADHAADQVTRRSHTGVLLYVNTAPVTWYSKRQNTVETSTFGSEFVAMKIATELIIGLRYKLRMMGIPIDGPASVFCDSQSVVVNSSIPESTLKKKHVSICYHRVREAVAAGITQICKEHTDTNLADILTKCLPGPRHHELTRKILY